MRRGGLLQRHPFKTFTGSGQGHIFWEIFSVYVVLDMTKATGIAMIGPSQNFLYQGKDGYYIELLSLWHFRCQNVHVLNFMINWVVVGPNV